MSDLTFTRVTDDLTADAWAQVHNQIIPSDPLTVAQVVERSKLYVLDLATIDGMTVGCSTVRPALGEEPVTVIVRILPTCRRRGLGSALLEFASRRGFVETDRYTLEGESVPYIHLASSMDAQGKS